MNKNEIKNEIASERFKNMLDETNKLTLREVKINKGMIDKSIEHFKKEIEQFSNIKTYESAMNPFLIFVMIFEKMKKMDIIEKKIELEKIHEKLNEINSNFDKYKKIEDTLNFMKVENFTELILKHRLNKVEEMSKSVEAYQTKLIEIQQDSNLMMSENKQAFKMIDSFKEDENQIILQDYISANIDKDFNFKAFDKLQELETEDEKDFIVKLNASNVIKNRATMKLAVDYIELKYDDNNAINKVAIQNEKENEIAKEIENEVEIER